MSVISAGPMPAPDARNTRILGLIRGEFEQRCGLLRGLPNFHQRRRVQVLDLRRRRDRAGAVPLYSCPRRLRR